MPQTTQRPLTEEEKRTVEENMGLVYKIARCAGNSRLPFDDRVQAGTLGLMRAVQKYDPSKGTKLCTYAVRWIKSMLAQWEARHTLITVPLWVRHSHADASVERRAARHRRHAEEAGRFEGLDADPPSRHAAPDSRLGDVEESAWLALKVSRMPARHREVLISRFWRGEKLEAIGDRYGVTPEAVRLWELAALRNLRAIYEAEYAKGA